MPVPHSKSIQEVAMIDGKLIDELESIVGKGENWLTEMTTGDLRKMIELR